MKSERGILSLLVVLLIFAAVGGAVAWRLLAEGESTPTSTAARPELPDTEGVDVASVDLFMESRPVEGVSVVRDTLWLRVVGTGYAAASRQSAVATRASGVVQGVFVQEGQRVQEGDLLVQLDTIQAGMNLIRARSNLTRAQARYEVQMLQNGDLLTPEERASREEVVRAETGLIVAELDVAEREMDMEFTRVRAPFSGRVADLRAVEGAYMGSGEEVLTLAQLDPIRVTVDVLESELGLLGPGRRASVRFSALGGETFPAVVESVNPRVDPANRAGRVTVTLPNPAGRILPGFYANVSLDSQPFPDRVIIPRSAVTTRGDRHREVVFLLKNDDGEGRGLSDWKYVTLGRRNDTHVEIVANDDTSMLEPGDIVLVNGHHYLAHDTRVHLVDNVLLAGGTPGR